MQRIAERLYLASCEDAEAVTQGPFAVVMICEWPCRIFSERLGRPLRTLVSQGRETLVAGKPYFHLDLPNLEIPNYRVCDFVETLERIKRWQESHEVVILSEHAESRGASLGMLWLAFRARTISRSSFRAARMDFQNLYPRYAPWPGLVIFLEQEWDAFA
ncbi:MAG: hypothetical protein AB1439_08160 [candidate division FCPU426 bacterium]